MRPLRIGTRGSQLALFQARAVAALLQARVGRESEIVVIKTSGDRLSEAPLSEIGGKRLFVKEIEDALLAGTVDLAVHSSKDMPAVLPDGLEVAAVLPREDPSDAIVLPITGGADHAATAATSLADVLRTLGDAPRIGTSSIRRVAQLTTLMPRARFAPIRGNLDTRLRKLDTGEFDAIVLASAGLRRLEFGHRISLSIPLTACVPAPGQGIIAIEVRADDEATRALMSAIDDRAAAAALAAERAVVRRLGGGCQMPIGAIAALTSDTMRVDGIVISPDGATVARADAQGPAANALALGERVAELLLERGAGNILAAVEQQQTPVKGVQP